MAAMNGDATPLKNQGQGDKGLFLFCAVGVVAFIILVLIVWGLIWIRNKIVAYYYKPPDDHGGQSGGKPYQPLSN
jgi:hypothetical protein